jgi:hypothetical protein
MTPVVANRPRSSSGTATEWITARSARLAEYREHCAAVGADQPAAEPAGAEVLLAGRADRAGAPRVSTKQQITARNAPWRGTDGQSERRWIAVRAMACAAIHHPQIESLWVG